MSPCLYGSAQVDARFDGDVVRGLEEGPLQEQGGEEQHSQHVSVLQKLLGGNEIDPQQSHLEAAQVGGGAVGGGGGARSVNDLQGPDEGGCTA